MRLKKHITVICILLAVLSLLGGWFFYKKDGNFLSAFSLPLTNVTGLSGSASGDIYVINDSGEQIVRIGQNGQADLVLSDLKETGAGSETIKNVAADADGGIYVHSVFSADETLSWYSGESIRQYDADGHFVKTVFEEVYDVPKVSTAVKCLQSFDGRVYAVLLRDDQILVTDLAGGDVSTLDFPDAARLIRFVAIDGSPSRVYAYTKDGRILSVDTSESTLYETSANDTDETIFSALSVSEDGVLYLADAAAGTVYQFEDGSLTPVLSSDTEDYFITQMDLTFAPVFTDGASILRTDAIDGTGESGYLESVPYSLRYRFYHIACILCLVLGIVSLLILAFSFLIWLFTKSSLKVKLLTSFAFLIGLLSIGLCVYFGSYLQENNRDHIVESELTAAKNVDRTLDKSAFLSLRSCTDYDSDAYAKVKTAADAIMLSEDGTPGELYLILYTYENDECLYIRYSEDEDYGCNYPYYYSEDDSERTVLDTGEAEIFDMLSDSTGVFQSIYYPITAETYGDSGKQGGADAADTEVIGIMEVGCDLTSFNNSIRQQMQNLLISIAVLCIVLLMIILEFVEFADGKNGVSRGTLRKDGSLLPVKLYRLAVFLVFFLTNITTPFLAYYALHLSDDLSRATGISAEILAAVPISAEVLSGAVFSFLGSGIIRRLGSRKASILGSCLFAAGLAVRVLYPDLLVLTAGNLIQGAGWGIVLLVINVRLSSVEDEELQESGFTDYNIAVENGVNSGVIFGGFLLAYMGYQTILLVVAILSLSLLLYSFFLIYDEKKRDEASGSKGNLRDYLRFLMAPRVFLYFLLIVLPVISASYYLNYLYPILAENMGLSEDFIGYSYLLNGMVTICFSNMINTFVAKKIRSRKLQMMLASCLYLIMFGLVGYFNNLSVLLVSLVLMAVACSFGYMAQSVFYADLKEVKELGYEKAMGVYSLFENLAQTAGSFLFGYVLILGVQKGLTLFGAIIAGCGILFAVLLGMYENNRKDKA